MKNKKITTLNDAFILKLQSLYDIENQLVKALPKMAENATDPELKKGFTDHLEETKGHVTRLEDIFERLDLEASKVKVEAIRGLVKDAEWIIKQKPEAEVLDSMLIAAATYVEHYEMAGYISAYRWAMLLEETDVANILQKTLHEEEVAAEKLVSIADGSVDERAMNATEEG